MRKLWYAWKEYTDGRNTIELIIETGGFTLSLLAFVTVLLHPYYFLHFILCLLSMICIILIILLNRTRKKTFELDKLFNGDIPLIATFSYLMNSRKREKASYQSETHKPYNDLSIHQATITYSFNEFFDDSYKRRKFSIKVKWLFSGTDQKHDQHRMSILVSNSLLEKNTTTKFYIKKYDHENYGFRIVEGKRIHSLQRYLDIFFTGNGIPRDREFKFAIIMSWDETYRVDSKDYYIIDPMNYSNDVQRIKIRIQIKTQHSTPFEQVSLQAHNRDTFTAIVRNWPITLEYRETQQDCLLYKYSFIPNRKYIYMLELKRKRCNDY